MSPVTIYCVVLHSEMAQVMLTIWRICHLCENNTTEQCMMTRL